MFCKHCGAEVSEKAAVCVKCGVSTEQTQELPSGTIPLGYALSFFMPIIGMGIGVYSLVKGRTSHGIGMIALGMFSSFFWLGVLGGMANAA